MSNIREKHEEKGITNFANCIKCHKSANENAVEMKKNELKKYINKELKNNKEDDDD
jgi:cytochrome c peroxidase